MGGSLGSVVGVSVGGRGAAVAGSGSGVAGTTLGSVVGASVGCAGAQAAAIRIRREIQNVFTLPIIEIYARFGDFSPFDS